MRSLVSISIATAALIVVGVAAQDGGKTTWDGVYSAAQEAQGAALYAEHCARCHGSEGGGGDAPELAGGAFASDFDTFTLNDLVERTQVSMPADNPGSLSRDQVVPIVAHLLALNRFPAGQTDLPTSAAALRAIKYVAVKPAGAAQAPPAAAPPAGAAAAAPAAAASGAAASSAATAAPASSGATVSLDDEPAPTRLRAAGVLDGPDPKQLETAPPLGFAAVKTGLMLPADVKMGAPSSVAFDKSGNLFVFNRGQHPLMEFDTRGMYVRSFGEGQFTRPHGMRIDPDGNIWMTDVAGHTVTKMSPSGQMLLTLGTKGQSGTWDEAAGTHLLFEPCDLAFAPNGDVFVVEGHGRGEGRVLKFDKSGKFLKQWGSNGSAEGQFNQPHSLLVRDNQLYVADRENHRVQIFDLDGKFVKTWKFAGLPCGLLNGPDGALYLTSGFSGQVLKLDANGKPVGAFGQPGPAFGDFGEAHYMAVAPNGDIYVADTINQVLHRYAKR